MNKKPQKMKDRPMKDNVIYALIIDMKRKTHPDDNKIRPKKLLLENCDINRFLTSTNSFHSL